MDGYLHYKQEKLVLQVSKKRRQQVQKGMGQREAKGGVIIRAAHLYILYICAAVCYLRITLFCVQVKNKPCIRRTGNMRLIPWTHPRGSETLSPMHSKCAGATHSTVLCSHWLTEKIWCIFPLFQQHCEELQCSSMHVEMWRELLHAHLKCGEAALFRS